MRFITPAILILATAGAAASFVPAVAAQAPAVQGWVPGKTSDGYPNIEGVWRAWNLAKYDLEDHGAKPGIPAGRGFVVDPADGKIPYKPEMLARRQKNYQGTLTLDPLKHADPLAKCYMPGVPRLTYLGWPFQIIQDKQDVNFTYEWSHKKRIVPIGDNSPLPKVASTCAGMAWPADATTATRSSSRWEISIRIPGSTWRVTSTATPSLSSSGLPRLVPTRCNTRRR
jgi:hypothetical protein